MSRTKNNGVRENKGGETELADKQHRAAAEAANPGKRATTEADRGLVAAAEESMQQQLLEQLVADEPPPPLQKQH